MSTGGTTEVEVVLDADGKNVDAAFAKMGQHFTKMQSQITGITTKLKATMETLDAGMLQSLGRMNQAIGKLDQAQKNINRFSPVGQADTSWAERGKAMKADQAAELRQISQVNAAYGQRDQQLRNAQDKRNRQEAAMWTAQAARTQTDAQKQENLSERRYAAEQARELRLQTQRETGIQKTAKLTDQNRLKSARDRLQGDVGNAKGLRDLENQRLIAADRLTRARSMMGKFGAEEDRQLHSIITLEKERLRLAETRIRAETGTLSRTQSKDVTVGNRLDLRSAKFDERDLGLQNNLGAAKARQAQLEAQILANIQRAHGLSGQAKVDAEQLVKLDETRLRVTNARVAALQREHNSNVQTAQKAQLKPSANDNEPSGGGGLFGSTGLTGVLARTAGYGAAAAAIYAFVGAIRNALDFTIKFEDALARLGAISGGTATQVGQLRDSISEVAANSRYSTLDLTEAATTLAQAGFTQGEIEKSLASVSQLATASGVTIAEATDVVTSAIGAFQLQAGETAHINDVLASALNRSKLTIQQVALGIQYAGATAYENKISFEELTAVFETMADAGIKSGSTQGTGVRQFLVDLQTPTKKLSEELTRLGLTMADIDVDQLGVVEVLNRLAAAGFDSAAAYKTLETRAAAAYLILRNNRENIQQNIIENNQLGQSAEAAAKGQASLTGEWQRFLNIVNGSVSNGLEPAANALKDFFKTINDAASDKQLAKLQAAYDAKPSNETFDALSSYSEIKRGLSEVEAEWAGEIEASTTALNQATDAVGQQHTKLESLDSSMARVFVRGKELSTSHVALQAEVSTLTTRFAGLANYLDSTALSYGNLTQALHLYRLEQMKTMGGQLLTQETAARAQSHDFFGSANSTLANGRQSGVLNKLPNDVRAKLEAVRADPYNEIKRRRLLNASENLKGNQGAFVSSFLTSVDKGVSARLGAEKIKGQGEIVGQLNSDRGQTLQRDVSELAGKSDSVIKAKIASLQAEMKGKSKSVQGAYGSLITEAQGFIGSGATPEAPASKAKKKRGDGGASKREHAEDRRNASLAREEFKAAEAELTQALKGITDRGGSASTASDGAEVIIGNKSLTSAQLKKNLDRADKAFDTWVEGRTAQVEAEIDSQDMGAKQAELMRKALAREVEAKREENGRVIEDALIKAMDIMVKAVTDIASKAEKAADQFVALAEARLASLDRFELRGKVPDYVKANYERYAQQAREGRERQQIGINETRISGLQDAHDTAQANFNQANDSGNLTGKGTAQVEMTNLQATMDELRLSNEALKVSFQGQELVPKTIGEAWHMAVENFKEAHQLTQTWGDMIKNNLGGALEMVAGTMEQFLNNLVSGTMTIKQAFQSMVKSIIQYLMQLIIKMLVVKALQMAIGMIGGPQGGAGISGGATAAPTSVAGTWGVFNGGPVIGRSMGGMVENGVPSRDSVTTRLARGEFVQRKWAVDSVGRDFMADLNNRGKAAVSSRAPNVVMPAPAHQEMKVFVVANDEKPQMGPNDVLVAVHRDIMSGGQTKQLIKHIAQGG